MIDTPTKLTQPERDQNLSEILEVVRALKEQTDRLEASVEPLVESAPTLKELVEAWKSAAWFGKALKWLAGIIGAFGVIFAAVRFGISHKGG